MPSKEAINIKSISKYHPIN